MVEPAVDLAMSHENAALVMNQFFEVYKGTGLEPRVWDPSKIAIVFDHRVPAESAKTATNQKKIREFVAQQGITKFHDVRGDEGGICHQILRRARLRSARAGRSSAPTATRRATAPSERSRSAIGATEMAAVWALGRVFNVEVPATIKVTVKGGVRAGVLPKDLILHLIGALTAEGANFKVIEFHGEAIARDVDVGPPDALQHDGRSRRHVGHRAAGPGDGPLPAGRGRRHRSRSTSSVPDADAEYATVVEIDVSTLAPQIACPHTVDNVKPVDAVAGTKIHQIVIGSCTNGRLDDLEVAARILKGQTVAKGVRMLIFPASWRIYQASAHARLPGRSGRSRRRHHEPRLRLLPRRPPGRARRRRGGAVDHEPQLQGTDGQPECGGLPLLAGRRRRQRARPASSRIRGRRETPMATVV